MKKPASTAKNMLDVSEESMGEDLPDMIKKERMFAQEPLFHELVHPFYTLAGILNKNILGNSQSRASAADKVELRTGPNMLPCSMINIQQC